MQKGKILVTAALPYVNNIPHIGNIVGSHLPADIFARFMRILNYDVTFIGGADEHGTPAEVSANKKGISPKELCDYYYEIHKKIYEWFDISYDNFSRTSKEIHHKITQQFFMEIYKNGYIKEGRISLPYCENCKRVLPDRYVNGICPFCGYENARGDQCENCGKMLNPTELKNPKCAICGNTPKIIEKEHLFFDLKKLKQELKEWIESKEGIWKEPIINESLGWIKDLKERCITRDIKWGVKVPLEKFKDKVFYVWFDAPIGYISFVKEIGKNLWDVEENTKIYHFIGKDNIIFHTIFWPAMLIANKKFNLPYNVVGLMYLNYEGGKISKSKNWGIFCENLLNVNIESDIWRFYLTFLIPETSDTEWKWDEFVEKTNNELIGNFGNFVNRILSFVYANFNGKISYDECKFDEKDKEILKKVRELCEEYKNLMLNLRLRDGLRKILEISDLGNKYFQKSEPWKNKRKENLYICVLIVYNLSIIIHPFLPKTSKKIHKMLNLNEDIKFENIYKQDLKFKIENPVPLFKKLDKKIIEEVKAKVTKTENTKEEKQEEITYEDFKRVNLKVGTIEKVEEIPKSDKLLKLTVNLGKEKRTIVAGIKKFYNPSELINKQVIVVANLKPKKIANVESNGMLLAAEDDEGIKLLTVDKTTKEGSNIG